jgi:hypothetical protein
MATWVRSVGEEHLALVQTDERHGHGGGGEDGGEQPALEHVRLGGLHAQQPLQPDAAEM